MGGRKTEVLDDPNKSIDKNDENSSADIDQDSQASKNVAEVNTSVFQMKSAYASAVNDKLKNMYNQELQKQIDKNNNL